MKKHIHSATSSLLPLIDFFHPPFRKIMNLQTFRYAVCGGVNMLLGFLLYLVSFKYILKEKTFHFGFYALKAHVAALFFSFVFNVFFGFLLMKFVVFSDSDIPVRKQFFRYFTVCLFNLALNYILLKILVEVFHIYPVIAQVFTVIVVVVTSYIAQRNFSFKISTPPEIKD
ncbi:MAG: GtrA family protein [Chitinophagaceae bacterium]|nr:MAG: GtrA family protein [Chitinophagaceae bacterium]